MKYSVQEIVNLQKEFFAHNQTKNVTFRIQMLKRLKNAVKENEQALLNALYRDLGKSKAEAYMTELVLVYQEIDDAIRHLRSWAKPVRVRGTLGTFPAKNYIYQEPYGVVLILSPWNYPVMLALTPLIGAMAAGNCAVLKCSKSSPHTSEVIAYLINRTFPKKYLYCLAKESDYDEVTDQDYDHIFFTGSPAVGKHIMETAAKRLIPVTLELGGKSPCFIDESADLSLAAKRIAWGKFLNAGQTCIAVDYVLIANSVKQEFLALLQKEIQKRYADAEKRDDYPCIVNNHHYERLKHLLETENEVMGGQCNEKERKIAPAILPGAEFSHEIMKEEIFGPLLPVIGYDDLECVIATVKQRPKPLACYIFSKNRKVVCKLLHEVSFGGGCVNDAILHISNPRLPFGGVGMSGMGHYHGRYSFETFSHEKGVVENVNLLDVPLRYAPFTERKYKVLKRVL